MPDTKFTPEGSVPVSDNVGDGEPVAVAVNDPKVLTVKEVEAELVIAGGETRDKEYDAEIGASKAAPHVPSVSTAALEVGSRLSV